jgi:hypothetical protein
MDPAAYAAGAAPAVPGWTDAHDLHDDDEMILDTRSTVTTRVRRQQPGVDDADLDTRSTRTVRTMRVGNTQPIDDGAGDS